MKLAGWITLIYGVLVLLGGIMGHLKAGSAASLVAGGIFGILLIISSFGVMRDHLLPTYFALILILILDAFFTYRWLLSFQFMPSGFMTLITLAVLVALIVLLRGNFKGQ